MGLVLYCLWGLFFSIILWMRTMLLFRWPRDEEWLNRSNSKTSGKVFSSLFWGVTWFETRTAVLYFCIFRVQIGNWIRVLHYHVLPQETWIFEPQFVFQKLLGGCASWGNVSWVAGAGNIVPLLWFWSVVDAVYAVSNICMEALCFVTNVTQNDGGVGVKYFNSVFILELSAEHGGHIGWNYCSCKFTTWSWHRLQWCNASLTHQETDMYLIRVVLKG